MSIFSNFFGCKKSMKPGQEFSELPIFPLVNNPKVSVDLIEMDSDFFAQTFILSEDKTAIYVLAYGMEGAPDQMPYQLIKLDENGKAISKLRLEHCKWTEYPHFWWTKEQQLGLLLSTGSFIFTTQPLTKRQEYKAILLPEFIRLPELEELVYNEKTELYYKKCRQSLGKSTSAYLQQILEDTFLFINMNADLSEIWLIENEDFLNQIRNKHETFSPPVNQTGPYNDELTHLNLKSNIQIDYKIDYPRIKNIEEHVYELTQNKLILHFKVTNKDKQSLKIILSDNRYLTTSNSRVWLMHERKLYSIYLHP